MSGFLAALIQRAEGRLPVLQRRVRGLFEPPGGHADFSGPTGTFAAAEHPSPMASPAFTVVDRDALTPAIEPRSRASTAPDDNPLPAELQPKPRQAGPTPRDATDQGSDLRNDGAEIRGIARSQRTASAAEQRDSAATHQPSATKAMPGAPRRPSPLEGVVARSIPIADALHERNSVTASLPAAPSLLPLNQSQNGVLKDRTPQPAQAAALLTKAQPRSAVRYEQQARAAQPAPVQITIGRVEIHAVNNAADLPTRPAGPAAPRLSLDEYLRRRNGGVG